MSYYTTVTDNDTYYTAVDLQPIYDPSIIHTQQTIHYIPNTNNSLFTDVPVVQVPSTNPLRTVVNQTNQSNSDSDSNFSIRDELKTYCIRAGVLIISIAVIVCVLYSIFRKPIK